ncbi:hypothetical protein ACFV2H_37645 [Streptomyces sp. NPDC059629]|uniref:hypothetical protein n=1 Tax=Streptomyces sp. NPDC059629 TaxID=3346889 RepID=UPI0036931FC3
MSDSTLKITDSYLQSFVAENLQPFLDALASNPARMHVAAFATGSTLGPTGDGTYNQLLTGNSKGNFAAGVLLQQNYKKFATAADQFFTTIDTQTRTLIEDLKMVDSVLTDGEDSANITASEMGADLSNISFSGIGGGNGNGSGSGSDSGSGSTSPSGSGNNS